MTGTQIPRKRVDDNLYLQGDAVYCVRCDAPVGTAQSWLQNALFTEQDAQRGGSLIRAAPNLFVDAPIIFRQAFCPNCLTALLTEVIALADSGVRRKRIT